MKRLLLILLASVLIITSLIPLNGNTASAEEISTQKSSLPEEPLTIPFLVNTYQISEEWIYSEMGKGYDLFKIYQALKKQADEGIPYEEAILAAEPTPFVTYDNLSPEEIAVLDAVYGVKDSVYNPLLDPLGNLDPSVTDSTYKNRLLTMSSNMYDENALKALENPSNQVPYQVNIGQENVSSQDATFRLENVDFTLPGRNGLSFDLKRVYDNSTANYDIGLGEWNGNLINETKKRETEERFPLGKGWTWDISYIKNYGNNQYIYISGLGTYELDNNLKLIGYPWQGVYLEANTSVKVQGKESAYKLVNIYGPSQYFDSSGNLIQIKDAYGNSIDFEYTYDNKGNEVLGRIFDATKNLLYFTYSDSQIIVTNPSGTVKYNKTKLQGEDILTSFIDAEGRTTTYNYSVQDSYFNFLWDYRNGQWYEKGRNPNYLLSSIVHPTGAITSYEYGAYKKIIGDFAEDIKYYLRDRKDYYITSNKKYQSNHIRYNRLGDYANDFGKSTTFSTKVTTMDEFDRDMTVTTFDFEKQFIDHDRPAVYYNIRQTQTGGSTSKITEYKDFDRVNHNATPRRIEERTVNGTSQTPTLVTTRRYDMSGINVITNVTTPQGASTSYTYDTFILDPHTDKEVIQVLPTTMTYQIDGTIQHTTYNRNLQGTITQMIVRENSATGRIVRQINYNNMDAYGNPQQIVIKDNDKDTVINQQFDAKYGSQHLTQQSVKVTDADGNSSVVESKMEYDKSAGLPTKHIDGKGLETTYQYDKLGRMRYIKYPDQSQIQYVYDDVQNKVKITDPTGIVTNISFDPLGRKISETLGSGYATYEYTGLNQVMFSYDAKMNQTYYKYDYWGRLTDQYNPDGSGVYVEYNDIDRTVKTQDAGGYIKREKYDIYGRVEAIEQRLNSTTWDLVGKFTYDQEGKVNSQTDGKGNKTNFKYDVLGNLIYVEDAENKVTRYTYSLGGNLTNIVYPDGTATIKKYDEMGRLIVQTDPMQQSSRKYYDANGNLIRAVDRKGQSTQFGYNLSNLLESSITGNETIRYTYDAAGRRLTMSDGTGITKYGYSATTGDLTSIEYPDQVKLNYQYDIQNQVGSTFSNAADNYSLVQNRGYNNRNFVQSLQITNGGAALDTLTYEYYGNGFLKKESQQNGIVSEYSYTAKDATNSERSTLSLTSLKQFKGSTPINTYNYDYDINRNITGRIENGVTNAFTYDALDRIKTSSENNEVYTYDSKNNRMTLTSDRVPNIKGASYEYDHRDRLTKVTTEDGKNVTYRYNGDGLLKERLENGATTRYYYDASGLMIGEGIVGSTGKVNLKYTYIYNGSKLAARQDVAMGQLQYYSLNGHGDVIELRDAAGNILNKYTYDIWGNPLSESEQVPNIFRYSGEYWDSTTGLQYLRARWYDPSVGRFINEDTYEGELNDPLSLNLYTYVHNNPLANVDPTGHNAWPISPALTCAVDIANCQTNLDAQVAASETIANVLILDDIKTLLDPNAGLVDKTLSAAGFLPFGKYISASGKLVVRLSNGERYIERAVDISEESLKYAKKLNCNCFTAGTKVLTDEGEKPIEEIEVGDKVLAKDDKTGEMAYKEVEWLFQRDVEETYNITVGDEVITTTDEHPFWIVGKGWVKSKDLAVGYVLTTSDGKELAIEKIEVKKEHVTVYNFKVKDFHTYFVSNLGIWTHNSCWGKVSYDDLKKLAKADQGDIRKIYGEANDAFDFFKAQVTKFKEVKPGTFVGKDSNGVTFTYRADSKSGPPTIDVNGVSGVRKIKFLPES